ncbi:MAG: DUF4160 domain-containing protein [Ignavibacteria bacterium]|nr:DUF4160 domain-containing protein [Ignavibacteria bacterium]
MPQISRFFGIIISMYYNDHNPPHFHARYGEFESLISIDNFSILEGNLPSRALSLVIEWAKINKDLLNDNWVLVENNKSPNPIKPLQ